VIARQSKLQEERKPSIYREGNEIDTYFSKGAGTISTNEQRECANITIEKKESKEERYPRENDYGRDAHCGAHLIPLIV